MSKCSLDFQKRILDYSELYFIEFGNNFKELKQLDEYLSSELNTPNLNIQKLYNEFSDANKEVLNSIFEVYTGENINSLFSVSDIIVELPKNNIVCDFHNVEVSDLFSSIPHAKAYFDKQLHNLVITATKIGFGKGKTYVNNDFDLNNSIKELKNILFRTIQNTLEKSNVLDLYNEDGNVDNYQYYKLVIKEINDFFFNSGRFQLIQSMSGKSIPNITEDIRDNKNIYDAYNAAIVLVNFDNILSSEFGNKIQIEFKKFNNLNSSSKELKYKNKTRGIGTTYWKNDSHDSDSVEHSEDQLIKDIVEIIPQYDRFGNLTSSFLEMKDFYFFGAVLSDFELKNCLKLKSQDKSFVSFNENPSKALKWYLEHINKSENSIVVYQELKKVFESNYEFTISLDKFFNSSDLNISEKEANSEGETISDILGQIINNTYGASYIKYNKSTHTYEVQEMYKFNANNIQVQNTTFSTYKKNINKKNEYVLPKVFDSLDKYDNILNISERSKGEICNFITNYFGVHINKKSFNSLIGNLLKKDKFKRVGIVSVSDFKGLLSSLLTSAKKDIDLIKRVISESDIDFDKKFTDSNIGQIIKNTVGESLYIELRESYLLNYIIKPVMNIETLTGEKLPTFKLPTLTYKDPEILLLRKELEDSNPSLFYKNLYIKNEGTLLGTGTKLEVVNNDINKSAIKLTVAEQTISSFEYDFLENLLNNNAIAVMLGNYSDKNTVLTKIIDANIKDPQKGIDIVKLPIDDLLELVRTQSFNYYRDLTTQIFSDYKTLFETLSIPALFIQKFTSFDNAVMEINSILKETDILSLQAKYENLRINSTKNLPKLDFSEELHYSTYNIGDKRVKVLNQTIVDNYRIFANKTNFNNFVKWQEEGFKNKYINNFKTDKLVLSNDNNVQKYLDKLNIKKDEYFQGIEQEGHLNPLLKKWLWINGLFRNEYLYITAKGEYMHPHKIKGFKYRGDSTEIDKENYLLENSGRLSSMAKRNVLFTATIEVPLRNSKFGVPDDINIATIEDYSDTLYNYDGIIKSQEVHDGSSFIDAVYSKMVDKSYPAKGYSGTKKQFGTFITPYGVVIKKDAENVITNWKILNSRNSKVKLIDKKKQMLSIPISFEKGDFTYFNELGNNYYNYLGDIYRINNVYIEDNNVQVNLSIKTKDGFISHSNIKKKFNNLYDLWELFGGQHSTDENGNFNEGSNDLLYDIVTTANIYGEYPLKKAMIHIISNKSAIKAGATNVNKASLWEGSNNLMYSTLHSRFMGPQLDANHAADNSKIKEVTQVISALAQNPKTSSLALEAYNNIAKVIEVSMNPYKKYLSHKDLEGIDKDGLYNYISKKFIKTIRESNSTNLSKVIIDTFAKDNKIPFSNQNFFTSFVKDVIVRMNNEFISRYYSGTGAILIPSHGIYEVYDIPIKDSLGNVTGYVQASQKDLMEESLQWYKSLETKPEVNTNEDIFNMYIEMLLPLEDTTWDKIQLGDRVITNDGEVYLDTIDKYYKYKELNKNGAVKKVLNKSRDLKPTEIQFKINGISKNLFDLAPVKLKYLFNKSGYNKELIQDLCSFFKVANTKQNVQNILSGWTQRLFDMLDHEITMEEIDVTKYKSGNINFDTYFGEDNLIKSFDDVYQHYINNGIQITDYKFSSAEKVLGNLYKSKFSMADEESTYKVLKEGSNYFKRKIEEDYIVSGDEKNNDIKLIVSNQETPVYIRFVNDLSKYKNNFQIKGEFEKSENALTNKWNRVNQFGEKIYEIVDPENIRVINENGKEIILLKSYLTVNDENQKLNNFEENLSKLVASFNGNIKTFIPIMGNDVRFKKGDKILKLNWYTLKLFGDFSGFTSKDFKASPSWLDSNKDLILETLANKKFASWQKSLETVATRIPSQSKQSFMPMRNIGYFEGTSNDVYVSVHQIWLQGSDFDIDKAYILGSSFDSRGHFFNFTRVSDYSTVEQLNELEKFPIPTGKEATINFKDGIDITNDFIKLTNILNSLDEYESENILRDIIDPNITIEQPFNFRELPVQAIRLLNNIIRSSNGGIIKIATANLKVTKWNDWLLKKINSHNLSKDYIRNPESINNSIVSIIKQIISAPSSQLMATDPIDIQEWKDAADEVLKNIQTKSSNLSSWDMLSMFKQQRDAAVGKDDVGISANGLKSLFALSSYYNDLFKKGNFDLSNSDDIRRNNAIFLKNFRYYVGDRLVEKNIVTISDVAIKENTKKAIDNAFNTTINYLKSNAAKNASGFTSAATDNAKELLMAKINASVELASMHLYLTILGFTPLEVAEFMTSEVANMVVEKLDTNIFLGTETTNVSTAIKNIFSRDFKSLGVRKEDPLYVNLMVFKNIYDGAQELKILSSLLGVNQKKSANIQEINKFFSSFEKAVIYNENEIFGDSIDKLLNTDFENNIQKVLNKVFENNKQLNQELDSEYVVKLLRKLKNVPVKYIDKSGNEQTKLVDISGGNFDYRYYITNENYRELTKEYYNLIKNTFNIFDIIEKVPHFKNMIEGLITSHNILLNTSAKYNTMFSFSKDLIEYNSYRIKHNSWIKTKLGNKNFSIVYGKKEMTKGVAWVDAIVLKEWLKTDQLKKFTINVTDLLKKWDIDSFIMYTDNLAISDTVKGAIDRNGAIVVSKNSETNHIISLDTSYGIANFKRLMENVLLKIVQKSSQNKVLLNSLKVEARKNIFGLYSDTITSTFPLGQLSNPVNAEKFQKLLIEFNNIDISKDIKKIENIEGELLKWRDLFYIYNLVVNNEKSGDKRLTSLFQDYVKDPNSLAYNYLTFWKKVDSGEMEEINNIADEGNINSFLFYSYNKNGQLNILVNGVKKLMKVINPDFPLAIDLETVDGNRKVWEELNTIIRLIKSNGHIIKFNC